jgi:hypothetical protein
MGKPSPHIPIDYNTSWYKPIVLPNETIQLKLFKDAPSDLEDFLDLMRYAIMNSYSMTHDKILGKFP